ncbi:MAG: hypothetical protein KC431_29190, partial [Myxococcales bacterium]|nr:hypothetical protein [Myxococcales bacterium]
DLYSAHVVLYELLTLRRWIPDELTPMQAVLAIQDKQPPSAVDPLFDHPNQGSVPIELRHFLRRGLQPKREERPATAEDVIYDLEMLRSGECQADCPITFMKRMNGRLERFMDRRPGASMTLATLAGLAVVSGVVGWGVMLVSALI